MQYEILEQECKVFLFHRGLRAFQYYNKFCQISLAFCLINLPLTNNFQEAFICYSLFTWCCWQKIVSSSTSISCLCAYHFYVLYCKNILTYALRTFLNPFLHQLVLWIRNFVHIYIYFGLSVLFWQELIGLSVLFCSVLTRVERFTSNWIIF